MWSYGIAVVPLGLALGASSLFAAFVVLHARVDERAAWHDALRLVNVRAIARIARNWNDLPAGDAPPGLDVADHPYALDLDLFGRASLFQWLGPAATPAGQATLAPVAAHSGAAPGDRRAAGSHRPARRQRSVAHLLAAHGVLAAGARRHEIDAFLAWAEGPPTFGARAGAMQVAVLTILLTIWAAIALLRARADIRRAVADSAARRRHPVVRDREARPDDVRSRRRRPGRARRATPRSSSMR